MLIIESGQATSSGAGPSAFQGSIEEMKISYFVIGEKPIDKGYPLYICLHGGGGTFPERTKTLWSVRVWLARLALTPQ